MYHTFDQKTNLILILRYGTLSIKLVLQVGGEANNLTSENPLCMPDGRKKMGICCKESQDS
jgi:hypothetical protein